jgi:spore maturation protein SpmA
MLNLIWALLLLTGLVAAAWFGRFSGDNGVTASALAMTETAVMGIALPLAGMMMFWLGIMRLMEKAGLLEAAARWVAPVMRRLFPDVPANHPAMSSMILNLSANMLGLGNSATPLGLKAMTHLQELNPHKQTASNAMVTFLAMNTAAFTLLPSSVINYLTAAGVKGAHQVIVPTILATAGTTLTAILVARALQGLPVFRVRPDAEAEADTPVGDDKETPRPASRKTRLLTGLLLLLFGAGLILELGPPSLREQVLDATGLSQVLEASQQRTQAPAAAVTADTPAEPPVWRRLMNAGSGAAIPLLLVVTLVISLNRGVKVYEEFVEGAKEGFAMATRIMPFLVAMLVALAIFRSSGALLILEMLLAPLLGLIGFPVELLPMALMRPLSGSGSVGVLNEILTRPEASETLKFTAAIMFGSTETTFYVLAVYFGSVGIRKIRHAIIAGLTADVVGMMLSVLLGRLMFG